MSNNDGAPSWLTPDNAKAVASNPVAQSAAKTAAKDPTVQKAAVAAVVNNNKDVESGRPSVAAKQGNSDFNASDEEIANLKKHHLYLRVAYMITAILMSVGAVTTLTGASASIFFMCAYVFFFALLICCFEVGLKAISKIIAANFGFMYTIPGRFFLLCIAAGMCYSLNVWGKVAMGCMAASLLLNIYILCALPRFEEYLRKMHFYADKNFA